MDQNEDRERVVKWRTGRDVPVIEQRHRDAAAWAMDKSPDGLTWDGATASHVSPDRVWQMKRVAEAMARMERLALADTKPADARESGASFQSQVQPWLMACFGEVIAGDREERNHRFLEEALELVQACGCSSSEAHQLVDYVYGRPTGELHQEIGGVMVTLAALCLGNDADMHAAGWVELNRIWGKVEAIRAKQAAKPKHSPLPEAAPTPPQVPVEERATDLVEDVAQWLHDEGGFDEAHTNSTWPEHPDDTGQREGGFVRIVPSDVQAKFRDVARRLLRKPAIAAALSEGGEG